AACEHVSPAYLNRALRHHGGANSDRCGRQRARRLTDPSGPPTLPPMCTLIVGREVLGPETLIVGANRDEQPDRPTAPPLVPSTTPRVVGGRDRRAGGTWLAIRDGRAVVALLNRRGARPENPEGLRSRGLLALDTAKVEADEAAFAEQALASA